MIDKQQVISDNAAGANDTGSTAVQVALLTARINNLAGHLQTNKKDKAGQRGLQLMNGQRRRLLKYLERTDYDAYIALTDKLGIRRGQRIVR
ncbi:MULTISPECIES: 30S ribosomal protein S15 [Deinococcus]|jgi:SSU ribosomal protein S15P|uniref:Small ribosomal subunit protein uS15 n=1 Tax=Deinococcus radiodurans (strain ATCC 13939 / DSM 20539 / JCM 16871 / CCUG 27074 / LMG 4051 / NBRC 15346 / NCIMB 9279 / VKM B-1422 / R1) TaxID=243230 RepID=RS15_DEIRA|nr:30S ribosomal protein S15 [Deinococcus radiodurans]Q9RXH2.1 RecName: Full=Small ribosomal subunit protein uS15; AltName: Full=30S ribosomal protein S15 [Deinococcus radiodurans R1 = ATCC 13939 = DSM 20539]AAF09921.1 ribosomal protein S15 [Deinococcus radiodurans R1 = ATCC 13939 = DSM 20539]ANC72403.1 30S ribosomal protein S15 [Deinococcus radiodurans R1 = ATCC 13939 = DSM 20539]QEM72300.1 30S ribosomal protein S15 [Deinococcus radiodurans]QIP28539.1 30S ribosomal protein S15 [Deinococcus ra